MINSKSRDIVNCVGYPHSAWVQCMSQRDSTSTRFRISLFQLTHWERYFSIKILPKRNRKAVPFERIVSFFFNLLAVNLTFVSQDKGHAGDLMFFIFSTAKWKCYFEVLLKKKRVSPSSAERQNFSHPYILFFFLHFESIFQLYQKN